MIRQPINLPLTILSDATHVIIPYQYKISFRNENFLLYDGVENEGKRFIRFATPRQLNILVGALTVTLIPPSSQFLKFSTSFFFQGEYNSVLILCVFASMERKTEIMCRRVLEKVREIVEITCQTAICDLEKTSINSFMFSIRAHHCPDVFSTSANVYGPAFKVVGNQHYTKIMKQRGQSFRYFQDYVIRAYEALEEHICLNGFEQKFREFLNYYEDTFIGSHHRTGRSQPLFAIRLCNQSERTENGISQTYNKVEASLQSELSLVDVKINTIHMRTSHQNTRP
ncbi:hypothetical protein HZS_6515, partial [Henneguya salminicola]